jgi:hypothetical protein
VLNGLMLLILSLRRDGSFLEGFAQNCFQNLVNAALIIRSKLTKYGNMLNNPCEGVPTLN